MQLLYRDEKPNQARYITKEADAKTSALTKSRCVMTSKILYCSMSVLNVLEKVARQPHVSIFLVDHFPFPIKLKPFLKRYILT